MDKCKDCGKRTPKGNHDASPALCLANQLIDSRAEVARLREVVEDIGAALAQVVGDCDTDNGGPVLCAECEDELGKARRLCLDAMEVAP